MSILLKVTRSLLTHHCDLLSSVVKYRQKHPRQHIQTTKGPREIATSLSLSGGICWEILEARKRRMLVNWSGGGQSHWLNVCEVWVKATRQEGTIGQRKHEKRSLCKLKVARSTKITFKKCTGRWLTLTALHYNFYRAVQMFQHLLHMRQNPLVNNSESLPQACEKGALGYMHIFSRFPLMDGDWTYSITSCAPEMSAEKGQILGGKNPEHILYTYAHK